MRYYYISLSKAFSDRVRQTTLYPRSPNIDDFLCAGGIHDRPYALNGHRDRIQFVIDYNLDHDIVLDGYVTA